MTKPLKLSQKEPATPNKLTYVILAAGILVGSAIIVLNTQDLYLAHKNSATLSIPEQYLSGSESSMMIQASDEDGEPSPDTEVKVTLTRGGDKEVLWEGKTDDDGIAQPNFKIPDEVGKGELEISVGSETFKKDIQLKSSYSIIISTDKPIYQPGQTIHIRTLSYKGKDPEATAHDVKLEIKDPDGNKIFRKLLPGNEFGIASHDFILSDQLPLGNYHLSASIENKTVEKIVSVQEYVLPKYKISYQGLESWYVTEDTVEGALNASYMFGEPINGSVEILANTNYGEWETVKTLTGELRNGEFDFSIPLYNHYFVGLDINRGNAYLELNATVTDKSGHREKKSKMITISSSPINLMSLGDTNIHGQNSTYYFIARYPDGKPVPGAELDINLVGYSLKNYGQREFTLTTDSRGVAEFKFQYDENLTEITVDAKKGELKTPRTYRINLLGRDKGVKVLADSSEYNIGDDAHFDIFYSEGKSDVDEGDNGNDHGYKNDNSGTKNIFYDILSRGFVVDSGRKELNEGKAEIDFTITSEMSPMLECRVYKIQEDLSVVTDSVIASVGQDEPLNVNIQTDEKTYRPGDDVGLELHVTDGSGKGVASALGVKVVDLSVYELAQRFTGYEEIYLALQEDFREPQYQVLSYVHGTGDTLPADATKHVSKGETDYGLKVYQRGDIHAKNAADAEEESANSIMSFFIIAGALCYISLFALAAKFQLTRKVFISLIVVVSFIIPASAAVHYMTNNEEIGSDNKTTDLDNQLNENGGFEGGPIRNDMVFDGADDMAANGAPEEDGFGEKTAQPNAGTEDMSVTEPEHVRKDFPETWVWRPSIITDEKGEAHLSLVAPDTITTWKLDALASTKDARMGTGSANITVFQEFFIEPDIPVEVVRNDIFQLNIMVYNYHSEEQNITLKLENDTWFELLEGGDYRSEKVQPSEVVGVEYMIQAKDVGEQNVTITASSDLMADKVIRQVDVVPDGKKIQHIINGEVTDNMTVSELVNLSKERIENSEDAYLKLQGSMDAVAVDGAEEYIHFVSGCGEQSMSTLSIDVLAYSIVMENGSPEKLFEYETICMQGIQHELTFLMPAKNGQGRGIVWFPSDEDVHPWLTSWGLLTFQDAKDAGFEIDDSIIVDMQKYLISQQKDDGSFEFPERGLYETTNRILKSKVTATTAYITRALLYSGYEKDSHIKDAIKYVENNVKEHWDDPYTLAISLIVLEDGEGANSLAKEISTRLIELAYKENGTYSWNSDTNMISNSQPRWRGGSSSNTIETTAYAVMALSKHGEKTSAAKGVKYLLTHRIGGGFFSTQDTVVAFQALTRWGEINVENLKVDISINGNTVETRTINQSNSDLTYLIDLRPWTETENKIQLTSSGKGSILYQLYFEEYIPWQDETEDSGELVMDVEYDSTNISVNDTINATLSVTYKGSAPQLKMVLVDLRAPVGFSFNEEEFETMIENKEISQYEIEGRQVLLYLADVEKGKKYSQSYTLNAEKPIKATLQGVNAYDMYNPELKDVEEPVPVVCEVDG